MSSPQDVNAVQNLLEAAPIGVVIIDANRRIRYANAPARLMLGCVEGSEIDEFIGGDENSAQLRQLLDHPGETRTLLLDAAAVSKSLEITAAMFDENRSVTLFVNDISEKVALGRQLKNQRQPSRKLLYQLHSHATTMQGYSELIGIMLDEEPVVTGDRLNEIRRYHKEVGQSLQTLARLLQTERQGGPRPDSRAIPIKRKYIVIIDDEPGVATFVAELMKGLRHRVAAFTDPEAALDHCTENVERLDLVIVDESLPSSAEGKFLDCLLALNGQFPIVFCSESGDIGAHSARTYLCHKPIDINDLTRIVTDLL